MKKRHKALITAALTTTLALASTGCSNTATNSSNANASGNTSTSKTTNTTTTTPTSTGMSPEAVLKASFDAAKRKDVAAFKKSIATADMKGLEEAITGSGQNLDDLLKKQLEEPDVPMPDTLETRNEKINGDRASVEYKDVRGNWKTANFIKEGSEWKITLEAAKAEQPGTKKDSANTSDGDDHGKSDH